MGLWQTSNCSFHHSTTCCQLQLDVSLTLYVNGFISPSSTEEAKVVPLHDQQEPSTTGQVNTNPTDPSCIQTNLLCHPTNKSNIILPWDHSVQCRHIDHGILLWSLETIPMTSSLDDGFFPLWHPSMVWINTVLQLHNSELLHGTPWCLSWTFWAGIS